MPAAYYGGTGSGGSNAQHIFPDNESGTKSLCNKAVLRSPSAAACVVHFNGFDSCNRSKDKFCAWCVARWTGEGDPR